MCQQFFKLFIFCFLYLIPESSRSCELNSPEKEIFKKAINFNDNSFSSEEIQYLKKSFKLNGKKSLNNELQNLQQKKAVEEQRLKALQDERSKNEHQEKQRQESLRQQEQLRKVAEDKRVQAELIERQRQEKQRQESLRQREQLRKAAEDKRMQAELVERQRQERLRQENLQLEQQKLIEAQRLKALQDERLKSEQQEKQRQESLRQQEQLRKAAEDKRLQAELVERQRQEKQRLEKLYQEKLQQEQQKKIAEVQRLKAIEDHRLKDENDKRLRLEAAGLEKLRQEKERLKIEHLVKEDLLKTTEEERSKLQQEVLRLKVIEKQYLKAEQDERERQEKLETQRCEAELKEKQHQESLRQQEQQRKAAEERRVQTKREEDLQQVELSESEFKQHRNKKLPELPKTIVHQQTLETSQVSQEPQKASLQQNSNRGLATFQQPIKQHISSNRTFMLPPVLIENYEAPLQNDMKTLYMPLYHAEERPAQHSPQQSLKLTEESQPSDSIPVSLKSFESQKLLRTANLDTQSTSIETALNERATTDKVPTIRRLLQLNKRPPSRYKVQSVNLNDHENSDHIAMLENLLEHHNPLQAFYVQTTHSSDEEINVGPSRSSSPNIKRQDLENDVITILQITENANDSPNASPNRRIVGSPLRSPHVRRILFNENPKIEIINGLNLQENAAVTGAKATITTIMIMPPQFNWQRFIEHWEYAETGLLKFIKGSKFDNNLSYNLSYIPAECMTLIRKNATYQFLVPSFAYKNVVKKIHIPHLD